MTRAHGPSDTRRARIAKAVSTKEAATRFGEATSTIVRMIRRVDLDSYKETLARRRPYRVYQGSIEDVKNRRGKQHS